MGFFVSFCTAWSLVLRAGVIIWRRSSTAFDWLRQWWEHGLSGRYAKQFRDQTALKVCTSMPIVRCKHFAVTLLSQSV